MIRGHVARVLTTRELVINRGALHGVQVGMRFAVLDPKADNIKDPETGEDLGSIFRPKVNVEVTRVEKGMSLVATYRKRRLNVGGQGAGIGALGRLFEPPVYVDEYETFKASEQAWQELPEAQSYVKVGDPVVQLGEREEELQVEAQTGLAGARIVNARLTKAGAPPPAARRRPRGAGASKGEDPDNGKGSGSSN